MIVISVKGGLGNQMFQYASAYACSHIFNQEMIQDISFFKKQSLRSYKLGNLTIKNKEIDESGKFRNSSFIISNKKINFLLRKLNLGRL